MNKLSKAKRNQLVLVAMATVIAIAALWYVVITAQEQKFFQQNLTTEEMRSKLSRANTFISRSAEMQKDLQRRVLEVKTREATMAPERDTYAWMLKTITAYLASHKGLNISVEPPAPITEMMMLPNFYYKSCVFRASGSGHYHEIGKFIAEFENNFPYFNIQSMDITPGSGLRRISGPGADPSISAAGIKDAEYLEFRFEIVVPVKPTEPLPATK